MAFKNNAMYQIATLFGLGRLPGGGTWASLFVLFAAIFAKDPFHILFFFFFFVTICGWIIYQISIPFFKSKDPKEFVLDEVLGMAIALIIIEMFFSFFGGFGFNLPDYINNQQLLFVIAFILFRIFDISKIGPVGWIEDPKTAPLWWKKWNSTDIGDDYMAVVGDDMFAALLSAGIVIIMLSVNLWILS